MQLEKARVGELSHRRATRQNSLPPPTSSARWNNVANNNNSVTKNNIANNNNIVTIIFIFIFVNCINDCNTANCYLPSK